MKNFSAFITGLLLTLSLGALASGVGGGGSGIGSGVSYPLLAPDGSASAPSYSFSLDRDTGMYRSGANAIGFSANGGQVNELNATALTSSTNGSYYLKHAAGSAAAPVYSFANDIDTGWYQYGGNAWGFSGGGAFKAVIDDTKMAGAENGAYYLKHAAGTASLPSYAFFNDSNTGIYSGGSDTLNFATGGTLRLTVSSAGKFTSSKSCSANYVRLSPNYCGYMNSSGTLITSLTRDGCNAITLSTDTTALHLKFSTAARSANSIAQRYAAIKAYSDSGCTTSLFNSDTYDYLVTAYEFAATANGTTIGNATDIAVIPTNGASAIYFKLTDDPGDFGGGNIVELGYFD